MFLSLSKSRELSRIAQKALPCPLGDKENLLGSEIILWPKSRRIAKPIVMIKSFLILIFLSTSLVVQAQQKINFPKDFKWCVATSAHQVEGNNIHSDWWAWEQAGHIKNKDQSGLACDEWNRLPEDVQLMQDLHLKQYRFSVEWAKIEPSEGQWDLQVLDHYKREVALLHSKGIEPMVTLQHFTLPQWVAEKGGFAWDGFADAFAHYTSQVESAIGDQVKDWNTFNEPMVVFFAGYVAGTFPPQRQGSLQDLQTPMVNLLTAHAKAYHILHDAAEKAHRSVRVGVAHHLRIFDPANAYNPMDELIASISDRFFNWALPEAMLTGRLQVNVPFLISMDVSIPDLANTQDFFGVNYYSRDFVHFTLQKPFFKIQKPENVPLNNLGWEIYPEGMFRILVAIHQRFPLLPIDITENGVADKTDSLRPQFIEDHLYQVSQAIQAGVPVEGYCHWSLLDNFEWDSGFTPRFGLYEMDYKSLKRIPRPSALLYSKIAGENGFTYQAH
jgi:beta-glucosidase